MIRLLYLLSAPGEGSAGWFMAFDKALRTQRQELRLPEACPGDLNPRTGQGPQHPIWSLGILAKWETVPHPRAAPCWTFTGHSLLILAGAIALQMIIHQVPALRTPSVVLRDPAGPLMVKAYDVELLSVSTTGGGGQPSCPWAYRKTAQSQA